MCMWLVAHTTVRPDLDQQLPHQVLSFWKALRRISLTLLVATDIQYFSWVSYSTCVVPSISFAHNDQCLKKMEMYLPAGVTTLVNVAAFHQNQPVNRQVMKVYVSVTMFCYHVRWNA